jgi:ubiquinone/menaquinone biosynthesis C-methylase UbiE
MDKIQKTDKVYGYLWTQSVGHVPIPRWHYHAMQEVISEPIVRGRRGIEIGAGCGYDTYYLAKKDPACHIVGMDLSDGVFTAKKVVEGLGNASIMRGSALNIPAKDNMFDFAYSFGVLHHTPDPEKGISETVRVIKAGAPLFLYLYEDHSENMVKNWLLKMVTAIRQVTVKLPPKALYVLSCILSPVLYLVFTVPANIFKHLKATYPLYEKMPFNFAKAPFSLRGDIYDRLSAPIEYRFRRQELKQALERNNVTGVVITRLKATAGWVAWGFKKGQNDAR